MSNSDRFLASYIEGDEREILSLFNLVLKQSRSIDQCKWKFRKNPYAAPLVSMMRTKGESKILGYHIVMPFPLNFRGQFILACQSLDIAVHPDYQKQGIFQKTGLDCELQCKEAGVEALMCFPNQSSHPGFIRSLGWNDILNLRHYLLRLNITEKLASLIKVKFLAKILGYVHRFFIITLLNLQERSFRKKVDNDLELCVSATVPQEYDEFWENCRSQGLLSIWKDSNYFKWRYDDNPINKFSYLFLKKENRIAVLAVVIEKQGVVTLCELLVKDRDEILGTYFINKIGLHFMNRNVFSVEFLGYNKTFFDTVFRFFKRRISHENIYCGKVIKIGPLADFFSKEENWTITYGDIDFV